MSHTATSWAVRQRGIRPTAKIVLWHLADRHNPDYGCFPSQDTLADDCEMSVRSVRDQLVHLEEAGLIRRERRKSSGGEFSSDRYVLGFESDFKIKDIPPAANSADGEVSEKPAANSADGEKTSSPAANSRTHQRQILPPNLVIEPIRETVTRESAELDLGDDDLKLKPVDRLAKVIPEDLAKDFMAFRKSIRKPLSHVAAKLIVERLNTFRDPAAAIRTSIMNGWTSVFEQEEPGAGRSGTQSRPKNGDPVPYDFEKADLIAEERAKRAKFIRKLDIQGLMDFGHTPSEAELDEFPELATYKPKTHKVGS